MEEWMIEKDKHPSFYKWINGPEFMSGGQETNKK